jgi:hypothetical protein
MNKNRQYSDETARLTEKVFFAYDARRQEWAKQALEDEQFRNGIQWAPDQEKELKARGQVPLVINVIHPAVEQAKALLTYNKPKFQSVAREDSDTKTGRLFSDILTWCWDFNSANVSLKQTIDDYYVKGAGWMQAWSDPAADYGKGEVRLADVDPLTVYPDPNSRDIFCRDAANILVARILTQEQITDLFGINDFTGIHEEQDLPNQYNQTVGPQNQRIGPDNQDELHKHYRVIDRYTKGKTDAWHCRDRTTQNEFVHHDHAYDEWTTQPAILELSKEGGIYHYQSDQFHSYSEMLSNGITSFYFAVQMDPMTGQPTGEPQMVPGVEDMHEDPETMPIPESTTYLSWGMILNAIENGQIRCNQIKIDNIYRSVVVGRKTIYEGWMDVEHYPIVPLFNRHNRNPFPMSDVRFVRPIQEFVNKTRSLIVAHASNTTNQKVFVQRGSVDRKKMETEWAKAGSAIIEVETEFGGPVFAPPAPLPNELYKNEADARMDIQEILGIYALGQGDQSQAPPTFKGTIALDEFSQRRIKSKKDDIEEFLNQFARVVVQLIQQTYGEEKVIRLVQPNNTPKEVVINQPLYNEYTGDQVRMVNNITVGRYDVIIVSGSTLPSNRFARFEYYMDMYEKGLIDQVEVLKQTEVVDIEGVLNRFSEIAALKDQLAQAEESIKNLQGDLQTASRETMHAKQRAELEKFKAQLSSTASRAEAAQTLHKARLGDELKGVKDAKSNNQLADIF